MRKIDTGETVGVIRRLDKLCRVVPPAEFRKQLGMKERGKVEMFMVKNGIFIKNVEG